MSEIEQANRHHWDGRAKDYDTKPWQQKMMNYIYGELAEHRDMFDLSKDTEKVEDFKLLDYACGPGTVTRALLPFVSHIQGIDISDGMVAEYNSRSEAAGTSQVASAVQGNLLGDEPYISDSEKEGGKDHDIESNLKFNDFDAVIVGLGFHHFTDFANALRKLSQRVKPGGMVGIIDLVPSEEVHPVLTLDQ
jgi:SAM-dependent methyltransferase